MSVTVRNNGTAVTTVTLEGNDGNDVGSNPFLLDTGAAESSVKKDLMKGEKLKKFEDKGEKELQGLGGSKKVKQYGGGKMKFKAFPKDSGGQGDEDDVECEKPFFLHENANLLGTDQLLAVEVKLIIDYKNKKGRLEKA